MVSFFGSLTFTLFTAFCSSLNPKLPEESMSAASAAAKAVTVKIVSDVVWPFCYVGLRHLEAASRSSGVKVNLEWLPFLLNPNMSDEGENIVDHLVKKYGPSAASSFNDPNSRLKVMGEKVGIKFNNDRLMVNTKRAHALVEHLKTKEGNDSANALMVDMYKAYFEDAKNINDETVLLEFATKYGIDETEARFAMGDHNLATIAKLDRETKAKYGVNGVPFFMIHPIKGGRPVAFSGAYPPEIIAEQLEEAAEE